MEIEQKYLDLFVQLKDEAYRLADSVTGDKLSALEVSYRRSMHDIYMLLSQYHKQDKCKDIIEGVENYVSELTKIFYLQDSANQSLFRLRELAQIKRMLESKDTKEPTK